MSQTISDYQAERVLEVLRALESVPSSQLNSMIDGQLYDPELTEWMELSVQLRSLLIDGKPVLPAARSWANYHYGHVITKDNFPDLLRRYRSSFPVPSHVAVLLPAQGGLASAGKAIRDGILSAYLEQPGESSIRFYTSGQNNDSAIAAYLQARDDGATQIIGPLRIESTRALANMGAIDVPM
jgi:outer membrane PBP1 activator LpoA protein